MPLKTDDLTETSGPGYDYFEAELSADFTGDLHGIFTFGEDGIEMNLWMPGQKNRKVYSLMGPKNFRYYLPYMRNKPVPTLLVRQEGEAWNRPFIAIYEPSGKGVDASIKRVRRMQGTPESGDLVAVAVEHKDDLDGRIDYILNATRETSDLAAEGVSFQGVYGVATSRKRPLRQPVSGRRKTHRVQGRLNRQPGQQECRGRPFSRQ